MTHIVDISTSEAMIIDEALLHYDFRSALNQQMADRLREKIRDSVADDLKLRDK